MADGIAHTKLSFRSRKTLDLSSTPWSVVMMVRIISAIFFLSYHIFSTRRSSQLLPNAVLRNNTDISEQSKQLPTPPKPSRVQVMCSFAGNTASWQRLLKQLALNGMRCPILQRLEWPLILHLSFAKDVDVQSHKKIEYPGDHFDLIWTIARHVFLHIQVFREVLTRHLRSPYDEISAVTSENIPGLDDTSGSA